VETFPRLVLVLPNAVDVAVAVLSALTVEVLTFPKLVVTLAKLVRV